MRRFGRRSGYEWVAVNGGKYAISISGAGDLKGRYGSQKLFIVYFVRLHGGHRSNSQACAVLYRVRRIWHWSSPQNVILAQNGGPCLFFYGDVTHNGHDHRDGLAGNMRTWSSRGVLWLIKL